MRKHSRLCCDNNFGQNMPRFLNLVISSQNVLGQVTTYPKRLALKNKVRRPNASGQIALRQVTNYRPRSFDSSGYQSLGSKSFGFNFFVESYALIF